MPLIRLATRASAQARTQAQAVAAALRAIDPAVETELVLVETTGDRRSDVPLHTIGGQGVFVKEVQLAVLDGRADAAVHSAKDLPSSPTEGLEIGAFTERRNAADALVGSSLSGLAPGATVATGSVRRRAQLAAVRPDLELVELRGNIHTRLSKIPDGGAIVMAVAALEVLGLVERIGEVLDPATFVPAVGQGCVALEHRAGDAATSSSLAAIDHRATRDALEIERAFLAELGGGCSLPVGAHVSGSSLHAFLAHTDAGAIEHRTIDVEAGASGRADACRLARAMLAAAGG